MDRHRLPRSTNNALSPLIDFATLPVAGMMMTYWTYKPELAMLLEEIDISPAIAGRIGGTAPASTLHNINTHRLASTIVRSTTYWLEPEHVSARVYMYMLIYLYRIAWAWFARRLQLMQVKYWPVVLLTGKSKTRIAEFVIDQLYKLPLDQDQRCEVRGDLTL